VMLVCGLRVSIAYYMDLDCPRSTTEPSPFAMLTMFGEVLELPGTSMRVYRRSRDSTNRTPPRVARSSPPLGTLTSVPIFCFMLKTAIKKTRKTRFDSAGFRVCGGFVYFAAGFSHGEILRCASEIICFATAPPVKSVIPATWTVQFGIKLSPEFDRAPFVPCFSLSRSACACIGMTYEPRISFVLCDMFPMERSRSSAR